jgi:hypothetical protein
VDNRQLSKNDLLGSNEKILAEIPDPLLFEQAKMV